MASTTTSATAAAATEQAAECDEVTESLDMLDAVLLQFDEEKQTPPPPEEAARIISSLVGSPYQSLQRGQGTQTTFPRPNKKLSSQFGSLPFDLSSHAAPAAPPWLNKEQSARNNLHLPIQNPLTTTMAHSSEDEEQFSDDSLEGQVWSSDRDLSNDREDTGSRGDVISASEDGEKEQSSRDDGRVSIAWSIEWNNHDKSDEPDINGKGTYVIKDKKRRLCLEEGLFNRPQIATSKSSDHLHKLSKHISRGRSLPSLSTGKPLENGVVVPIEPEEEEKEAESRVNGFGRAGENSLDACDSLCEEEKIVEPVEAVNVAIITSTDNENQNEESTEKLDKEISEPEVESTVEKVEEEISVKDEIVEEIVPVSVENLLPEEIIVEDEVTVLVNNEEEEKEESVVVKDQVTEVEPEVRENVEQEEQVQAPPLNEILDSGSDSEEEEEEEVQQVAETPGPCELSFKIMRPKMISRPNSMPPTEENVVVYTNSVTLYPDAGLITYYDDEPKAKPMKEAVAEAAPSLLRPKSCSDITTAAFACVDISLDEEPLSLEPITIEATSTTVTITETEDETLEAEEEEEEGEAEELEEEVHERLMELPVKVDCLVQTDISGLGKRLCLESPGEQVVPSMAGFTPVTEHKSLELSLLAAKKPILGPGAEEVPAIEKPSFVAPPALQCRERRRQHLGSHTDVNAVPAHRHSVPESFLFPGSFTIPLSFAVVNKPGLEAATAAPLAAAAPAEEPRERRKELPPPPLPQHQNVPKYIENRPRQKTPTEPEYRSVHKNRPPVPPHQNLVELYSEPRSFPDAPPAAAVSAAAAAPPPPPPPPLAPTFSDQKPAVPEHKGPAVPAVPEHRSSFAEQPLPPTPLTPLTPDRPLPPSPRLLPTSASFPVPPVARDSPTVPHRPLPSPPNTLKTRSVDAGIGKGLRDQLKAHQGCTLPPDLGGATPRRGGGAATGRKKHRAPAVPPHASLPETPVFSRGCDIPRAPYRALGIPVLRSSLSEEGAALCGPGRGWYPKQRRPAARSTEHLEQAGWGADGGGGGGGRKPHTLPPNMSPPKFFHRSSPREALRRVTSLLIRGRTTPAAAPPPPPASNQQAAAAACETPQRHKRSFFRHFWKKSKHYSLEQ
ncbi:titin isoform X2 [Cloeon dipterum]|uniref:titin isoform X2 n=1 Tax=Cloeon dipterum TaxID=197152 RepID=UPI00321F6FF7